MNTLARLSFTVHVDKKAALETAYETRLAPILKKHGMVASSEQMESTIEGVFSRVFEVETPTEFIAKKRAISTAAGVTRYRSRRRPPGIALVDVVTDRHHGPVAEVELSASQPLLVFEFSGRSFKTRQGQMVYVYRLEGYDETWQQTRESRLVESELFGHERGAFTGATARKIGKIELAADGTLFLDEIGDLAPSAQVKLLRLLEEQTFERVGGIQTLAAQVRVIAATNRDLEQMVETEQFREDLYFRLQPFPVRLPPLRDRHGDIPPLAAYFVRQMAAHLDKEVAELSPEAVRVLASYDWPGNVRELEHVVKRAVILCRGSAIRAEDIAWGSAAAIEGADEGLLSLAEHERRYILKVLEQTGWLIKGSQGAAAILDLPVSTLRSRMKKLAIVRPREDI